MTALRRARIAPARPSRRRRLRAGAAGGDGDGRRSSRPPPRRNREGPLAGAPFAAPGRRRFRPSCSAPRVFLAVAFRAPRRSFRRPPPLSALFSRTTPAVGASAGRADAPRGPKISRGEVRDVSSLSGGQPSGGRPEPGAHDETLWGGMGD